MTGSRISRAGPLRAGACLAAFLALFLIVASTGCAREEEKAPEAAAGAEVSEPGLVHFTRGVQHSLRDEYDEAIAEYELSLKYNPHNASAYNNMGFAYFDKGDIVRAIEFHRKSLQTDPNLANGYYGLALALEEKGEKKEAIENWKEFKLRSEPGSKWWQRADEHIEALKGGG